MKWFQCRRHARHSGHDARGNQAEQGARHSAAFERGVALLESEHPVEGMLKQTCSSAMCIIIHSGARSADAGREHDSSLREGQGGLVDQLGALQSRTSSTRCHCRQDGLQEESGSAHSALPQGQYSISCSRVFNEHQRFFMRLSHLYSRWAKRAVRRFVDINIFPGAATRGRA